MTHGTPRRVSPASRATGLALLALLATGPARATCGDGLPAATRLLAEADGQQLAFAPQAGPLVTGRPFSLTIVLCPAPGQPLPASLVVDAAMPAHRHGMNYRPTVTALGGGRFRADGLLLHMAGRWRFSFEWPGAAGQPPRRLQREVDLR